MFEGMNIGQKDMNSKDIKEGDKVKFKSRLFNGREFEGIVKYSPLNCGFWIERHNETSFRFGLEIYDIEVVN